MTTPPGGIIQTSNADRQRIARPRGAPLTYRLDDSALPIPDALVSRLDGEWRRFGRAGTWWTAAERVAIAAEGRAAKACALCAERRAAVSPYAVDGAHEGSGVLPAAVVDAVHRIVTDPGRLSSKWYEELLAHGVAPEQLVEMAGILSILTIGDTLARAVGCAPPALPSPEPGEPSRVHPPGIEHGGGWVPMVHPDRAEGAIKLGYDMVTRAAGFVFNVARALTAVEAEWQGFMGVFLQSYNTHGAAEPGALTRPQMELLAASTSAANECFY